MAHGNKRKSLPLLATSANVFDVLTQREKIHLPSSGSSQSVVLLSILRLDQLFAGRGQAHQLRHFLQLPRERWTQSQEHVRGLARGVRPYVITSLTTFYFIFFTMTARSEDRGKGPGTRLMD